MDRSSPGWDARFAYPAQRDFLEYLKRQFGADRFQDFTVKYIENPDGYRTLFKQMFKVVKIGQWPNAN